MSNCKDPSEHATSIALTVLEPEKLETLSRNCPGLKTFDYRNYLECSICRIDKVLDFLNDVAGFIPSDKIMDCGSWLGNFSLALKFANWNVIATEMWNRYAPALDAQKKILAVHEVDTMDMLLLTGRPQGPLYGAICLMSVIEHIPDSPRRLLKILYDALLPGGYLILDTPNLMTLGNRRRFQRGLSCYPAIAEQFYTETPFEGHVREYTADELSWMLERTGFRVIETEFFNYSKIPFWKSPLGQTQMLLDPTQRELIFMVAVKPRAAE